MKLARIARVIWPTFRFNFLIAMASVVIVLGLSLISHFGTVGGETTLVILLAFTAAAFLLCLAHALKAKTEKIIEIWGK